MTDIIESQIHYLNTREEMALIEPDGAELSDLQRMQLRIVKDEVVDSLALLLELGAPRSEQPRLITARRSLLNAIVRLRAVLGQTE